MTAAVVPRDGCAIGSRHLLDFCRKRLAGFKTPKHIIVIGELPKNASGKILKRELRAEYQHLGE